ncbi:hypothetical protein AVEN_171265-1 [Araneus ventricosus]|uniref:Uncharacterized protein n=1 Tax=Araneus ventricosus TaxID=182803 RepID=A0A4Y2UW66_ARAVE|nr:hypothetical protein AVEN_171265-1 [Araneus ventricosus]
MTISSLVKWNSADVLSDTPTLCSIPSVHIPAFVLELHLLRYPLERGEPHNAPFHMYLHGCLQHLWPRQSNWISEEVGFQTFGHTSIILMFFWPFTSSRQSV